MRSAGERRGIASPDPVSRRADETGVARADRVRTAHPVRDRPACLRRRPPNRKIPGQILTAWREVAGTSAARTISSQNAVTRSVRSETKPIMAGPSRIPA